MNQNLLASVLSVAVLFTGCAGPEETAELDVDGAVASRDSGKADTGVPTLYQCWSAPKTFSTSKRWKHTMSKITAKLGSAHHRLQDVIGTPGSVVSVEAKFAYGDTDKDVEDEKVQLYFDNCATTVKILERTTNDDGRVSFSIRLPSVPGVFALHGVADGDGSSAVAYAWVLPQGTHFAVSDIDGTLTTSDTEILKQTALGILHGSYTPEAYPAATDLTWAESARNRIPLYLTGRPFLLKSATASWLWGTEGMAFGPIHVTEKDSQVLPSNSGVGAFKRDFLKSLVAKGYVLDVAFGNATTDIYAYEQVGIAKAKTFIIGTHAGKSGTQAVDGSWQDLADSENAASAVTQPFSW